MICDWSNYEEEVAILHSILQNQVDNIEYMIQHAKSPCHSPGHLLHYPFDITMVCPQPAAVCVIAIVVCSIKLYLQCIQQVKPVLLNR